eukprot:scaffold7391_cov198-Prasinococcus_capsulatus_cf.AAC.5
MHLRAGVPPSRARYRGGPRTFHPSRLHGSTHGSRLTADRRSMRSLHIQRPLELHTSHALSAPPPPRPRG